MSLEEQEYVFAPWGDEECETEIMTVELPSRELVVQLETPTAILERMAQLSEQHGISVEKALAERLEINRARVSLLAAKSAEEVDHVHEHLTAARRYLSGVETLETETVEAEIERVWNRELDE